MNPSSTNSSRIPLSRFNNSNSNKELKKQPFLSYLHNTITVVAFEIHSKDFWFYFFSQPKELNQDLKKERFHILWENRKNLQFTTKFVPIQHFCNSKKFLQSLVRIHFTVQTRSAIFFRAKKFNNLSEQLMPLGCCLNVTQRINFQSKIYITQDIIVVIKKQKSISFFHTYFLSIVRIYQIGTYLITYLHIYSIQTYF
eukprot:TRINITY_DN3546_c1_g1_i5.p1 TRINITY_DN3546_c1_g1~~TRINITY_DN3546_c1_g1_i5.p1  ORF type:complete len:198 (+),score=-18.64 TRINITY_DN3546_c1_g1_i5:146-739(+)